MMKLFNLIVISVVFTLASCSDKTVTPSKTVEVTKIAPAKTLPIFNSITSFKGKAPQDLFEDATIGTSIKALVPTDKRACMLDMFNYMPDLELKSDGSVYSSLNGSHADNWKYGLLSVFSSGEVDVLLSCTNSSNKEDSYFYFTNRTLSNKIPLVVAEWFEAYGQPTDTVFLSDGNTTIERNYNQMINKTDIVSSIPSESKMSDSCEIKGLKNSVVSFKNLKKSSTINDLNQTSLCNTVKSVATTQINNAINAQKTLCASVDTYVQKYGGYSGAIAHLETLEEDIETVKMLKILRTCGNPNLASELSSQTELSVYSIGHFVDNNKQSCIGALIGLRNDTSSIYAVSGLDKCSTFQSDALPEWTTAYNNKIPHGNFLVNTSKYDGALPATYIRKHQELVFYKH